jgi:FlaA1/EpsC-like NDP-sugar epimerase
LLKCNIINIKPKVEKKMRMKEYFIGKKLLVTGTTGFLGKVLL